MEKKKTNKNYVYIRDVDERYAPCGYIVTDEQLTLLKRLDSDEYLLYQEAEMDFIDLTVDN